LVGLNLGGEVVVRKKFRVGDDPGSHRAVTPIEMLGAVACTDSASGGIESEPTIATISYAPSFVPAAIVIFSTPPASSAPR
jgi:hypothetical protein